MPHTFPHHFKPPAKPHNEKFCGFFFVLPMNKICGEKEKILRMVFCVSNFFRA